MTIPNKFERHADSPTGPSTGAFAVTPSDTVNLPFLPRFVYCGTAGVIQIVPQDNLLTMVAVPYTVVAGALLMIRAVRILATGTTVTGIVIQN